MASGDHGIPGIPRSKCNLYDIGCEVSLAARWPGKIQPGRVVDDFVNIMDWAPTLCEASGVCLGESNPGQSPLPSLALGTIQPACGTIQSARGTIPPARDTILPAQCQVCRPSAGMCRYSAGVCQLDRAVCRLGRAGGCVS